MQTLINKTSVLRNEDIEIAFESPIKSGNQIAPQIATIEDVETDEITYKYKKSKPAVVETGADVKDGDSYNTEFTITASEFGKETFELTDRIYTEFVFDPINPMFEIEATKPAEIKEAAKTLTEKFDATIIDRAYTNATAITGGVDITDADTAKSALKAFKREGIKLGDVSDIAVVVNSNTMEYIEDLIEARPTGLGDSALKNGVFEGTVYGMRVYSVRPALWERAADGTMTEGATVLADGKAIAVVNKAVNVAKTPLKTFVENVAASATNKVNTQKAMITALWFVAYVRKDKKLFVLKNA